MTATANGTASDGAAAASASTAAPNTITCRPIQTAGGTFTVALGAMNAPHTTAASAAAPMPSSHWVAGLSPVLKPQYARAASMQSSRRNRTRSMNGLANTVSLGYDSR